MDTSGNSYDALEQMILEDNIRISKIDAVPDLDMLLVILNTGRVLQQQLSKYPLLKNATSEQLNEYRLIGNGIGIHWPLLDEDLSLKGFMSNTLRAAVSGNIKSA